MPKSPEFSLKVPGHQDSGPRFALASETRPSVGKALLAFSNEISPEQSNQLFSILEGRFSNTPSHYWKADEIRFDEIKPLLEANPALLASLLRMELTGGAPDLISVEDDHYLFADCSKEVPLGRRDMGYSQIVTMANEFGIELMDEDDYRDFQGHGDFDSTTWAWLKSDSDLLVSGDALVGGRIEDRIRVVMARADRHDGNQGWRGMLRVPKVR